MTDDEATQSASERAERASAAEREQLRVALASVGDAVITTDAADRVTFLNPVAERLTGWSDAEARGLPLAAVFRVVREHARPGGADGLARDAVLVARDGRELPIDDSASPIRTSDGAVLVFRDVSERRRAEEARARLAAIVESSADAIVSKSLTGVIRTWNAGAERLFRYTAAEVVGRPITIIIPPERLDEERAILGRLIRGERIEHFETVRVARDGRRLDISLSVSPILDAGGRIIGASKIARDISERKRFESALRRIADVSLALHDTRSSEAILRATVDEARQIFNAGFAAASLRTGDESVQGTVTAVSPRDDARVPSAGRLARIVCDSNRPLRAVPADFDRHPVDAAAPLRPRRGWLAAPFVSHAGANLGLLQVYDKPDGPFSASDEALLAQLTNIAAVTIENTGLYAALREQDRRKDEFIALLAHELRNPLVPIRSGLQVMRMTADPEVRARLQDMMERQLGHMVRLIDDLLDISRINSNKVELRRTRLTLEQVVTSAIETAQPFISAGGHHLEVALPPAPIELDADLTRLAQVFSNLLTNSAKYTEPGGHIRLSAERDGDAVVVAIHDDGIGIPPHALHNVFDMFAQVDGSLERSRGGLGIGLALVKGLVAMHGGSVTAESAGPGRGSTFSVRLPAAGARDERPEHAPTAAGPASPGRRILVVDDNPDIASTMATMLELLGHEVRVAHDGVAAIDAAEAFRPAAILMDIGMPRLNGLDACRRIRQQPWGAAITILALSGWGQGEDRARSYDAGCDGHLIKPISLSDLVNALDDTRAD